MKLFPAIDIYDGKAVRLYKGDYSQMTIYNDNPINVALDFKNSGCKNIHLVDLEGAKVGISKNFDIITKIKKETGLFCEVGGGIRSIDTIESYVKNGIDRVILGTAAVENEEFLKEAIEKYGDKIACGVDVRDGFVSVKGWTENSSYKVKEFLIKLEKLGIKTVICTDISKDGAMKGLNYDFYKEISSYISINIIASGGVSSLDNVIELNKMNMYGAIIGKAYYTGAINLKEAKSLVNDN